MVSYRRFAWIALIGAWILLTGVARAGPAQESSDDWLPAGLRPFRSEDVREQYPDLYRLLMRANYLAIWVAIEPRTKVVLLKLDVVGDRFVYKVVTRNYTGTAQHYTSIYDSLEAGRKLPPPPYELKERVIEFELGRAIHKLWIEEMMQVSYRHTEPAFQLDGADYYFGATPESGRDWSTRATEDDREVFADMAQQEKDDVNRIRDPMLGRVWSPRPSSRAGRFESLAALMFRFGRGEAEIPALADAVNAFKASFPSEMPVPPR